MSLGNRGESEVGRARRVVADFVLHPLIYTRLRFNLAQNAESGQAYAVGKVVLIDTGGQKPMGV